MSKLLETSELLKQLNQLWDEHSSHINKANTSLKNLLKTSSNIPSDYLSKLKSISDAQEIINASTRKLNTTTKAHIKTIEDLNSKRSAVINSNKQLADSISNLEKKINKANKELADMKSKSASTTKEINSQSNSISQLSSKIDVLNNKLNSANSAVAKIGNTSKVSFGAMWSILGAFGISQGIYLATDIIKNIYNTTKELQSMDLALKMVTETEDKYVRSKEFLLGVSEKWGLEIKSLTQQYIQFYTSSKGLLSDKAIETTFEGIAKAGAIIGLSLEKQSSAFYAIDQMMSKGTVSSEELKKQLGNALPGAIKAAAMAYMELHPQVKTIQEAEEKLYAAMKKGALDSATYVPLIVKNFEKLYGIEALEKVDTLVAAENRLKNSWTELVKSMNETDTSGIQSVFKFLLNGFNSMLYYLIKINDSWNATFEKAFTRGKSYSKEFFNDEMSKFNSSKLTNEEKQNIKDRVTEIGKEIIKAQKDGFGLKAAMLDTERKNLLDILFYSNEENKISKLNKIKEDAKIAYTKYATEYNKIIGEAYKKAEQMNFTNIAGDTKSNFIDRYKHQRKEDLKQFMGTEQGLIDLANQELYPAKITNSNKNAGEDDSKSRRERVKLNFDWIKSEYELKKAILETQKVQYAYDMDNENKTLAERISSRVEFSKKSLELIKLETDAEKAANVSRYLDDLEKNRVAFKNKDINQKEYNKNIKDLNKRLNNEQLKADEIYSQRWQELLNSNYEFYKKINDKKLEYQKRTSKAEIEFYKDLLQQTISSKSASDDEVLKAIQELRKLEYDEAVKSRDEQLKLAGDEADLKTAIWAEYGKKVQDIDAKMNNAIEANRQRRIKREAEILDIQREAKGYTTVMGEKIPGYLNGVSQQYKDQYEELLDNYEKAVASGEEDIIAERKRQLDEFISYIKSVNGYANQFFTDFVSNSGFGSLFNALSGKIKGFGEDWKVTFLAILSIAEETISFLDKNSSSYFENERNRLDERYNYELQLAGDNDAAKQDLERHYEARKKDIANREAKHERDMAIFKIGIDTAQAIMGLWVDPGFPEAIPLAITVGALGTIQMAMVASKQIPQYYKGTENSEEGFAWVDEFGPELHFDKNNNLLDVGSNKGPRLKYLKKGDKIVPANKSVDMLSQLEFSSQLDEILFNNGINYYDNKNITLDDTRIISSLNSLKTALVNEGNIEEYYDERGYNKYKIINGQRINDKANRIRFKRRKHE